MSTSETLHPNLAVLQDFDPANPAAMTDKLADDVVFHYFNPELPEVQGDYVGHAGFQRFFKTIGALSKGRFKVKPISIRPYGDELVVTHTKNTMALTDKPFVIDAVVVWRIVDGKIKEAWDIPAVYTAERPDI